MLSNKMPSLLLYISFGHLLLQKSKSLTIFIAISIIFLITIVSLKYFYFFDSVKLQVFEEKQNLFHVCIKSKDLSKQNFVSFCENEENTCTICFEECNESNVCELNCGCQNKFYHVDCIKTWVYKNPSCPICRVRVYD